MNTPNTPGRSEMTLQEQELELKRAQLAVEFAKYGFAGTLTAAIGGMVLILGLAIVDALSDRFTFGWQGVLGASLLLTVGTVAFGGFSLWQPLKILARFAKLRIEIHPPNEQ